MHRTSFWYLCLVHELCIKVGVHLLHFMYMNKFCQISKTFVAGSISIEDNSFVAKAYDIHCWRVINVDKSPKSTLNFVLFLRVLNSLIGMKIRSIFMCNDVGNAFIVSSKMEPNSNCLSIFII